MALIIEDGTIVVGANSFVTAEEAMLYAESRNEVFETDDEKVEGLLLRAMDYIDTYRSKFSGKRVSAVQSLLYPRTDSLVDGDEFPSDAIPRELKLAQMQLAVDAYNFGDLQPSTTGYAIAKEKVDVLEVEYAAGGRLSGNSPPATPSFPKADAWLEVLCGSTGSWLTTVRI